jgi:hypothetical protein
MRYGCTPISPPHWGAGGYGPAPRPGTSSGYRLLFQPLRTPGSTTCLISGLGRLWYIRMPGEPCSNGPWPRTLAGPSRRWSTSKLYSGARAGARLRRPIGLPGAGARVVQRGGGSQGGDGPRDWGDGGRSALGQKSGARMLVEPWHLQQRPIPWLPRWRVPPQPRSSLKAGVAASGTGSGAPVQDVPGIT